MQFLYTDDLSGYQKILNSRIVDMPCKHVMNLESEKARALRDASVNCGYYNVLWGYGTGICSNYSDNRIVQIHTVSKMIYKCLSDPFRIVIDRTGYAWIDNLHSAIRDVIVFGDGIRVSDARFYIVDLSRDVPVAAGDGTLSHSIDDIMGAVDVAVKRDQRVNDAVRAVGYTIGEFMKDNLISREAVNLPDECFALYVSQSGVKYQRPDTGCGADDKVRRDMFIGLAL